MSLGLLVGRWFDHGYLYVIATFVLRLMAYLFEKHSHGYSRFVVYFHFDFYALPSQAGPILSGLLFSSASLSSG